MDQVFVGGHSIEKSGITSEPSREITLNRQRNGTEIRRLSFSCTKLVSDPVQRFRLNRRFRHQREAGEAEWRIRTLTLEV